MIYNDDRSREIKDLNDVKSIAEYTEEIFATHWNKSVSYGLHRLKKMESKKVGITVTLHNILLYMKALNFSIDYNSKVDEKLDKKVLDEVIELERESGYCIHLSVLTKTLMDYLEPKESKKIQYYQGFSTLLTEDAMAAMIFGSKQVGIHAWLTYENAVMDVTAIQHKHSITLPKNVYGGMVIGELPESYELSGFKENESIIKDYQEMFAEKMNLSREEWIKFHVNAYKTFIEK